MPTLSDDIMNKGTAVQKDKPAPAAGAIHVTKTFLPPLELYHNIIKRAWDAHWLTNRGPLVLELEEKLKQYLNIADIIITNNGTLPLQIALKLLAKGGEVITTPFSYVATVSAIVWEGCTPVFVDIHPDYLTINETKIEAAITEKTTAILATHVFGNPCNVDAIEALARKYNLSVIYDAAHAFGVTYNGRSVFEYGDVSTCSFHATKLFHTGEGGAMFARDPGLFHQLFYSHNFGHNGPLAFHGLGINAKISELQAAMGLAVLPYIENILLKRQKVVEWYKSYLDLSRLRTLRIREGAEWNYSYFPVIFETEEMLVKIEAALQKAQVFPRRYFYPSLNSIDYAKGGAMPVSETIASTVLCLPLYEDLAEFDVMRIIKIINDHLS